MKLHSILSLLALATVATSQSAWAAPGLTNPVTPESLDSATYSEWVDGNETLVFDVPSEAMLTPGVWGTFEFKAP